MSGSFFPAATLLDRNSRAAAPERDEPTPLAWHALAGAPLHFTDARMLAARGAIIMAQRHFPDRVERLVRPAMEQLAVPAMPKTDSGGQANKARRSLSSKWLS
jgi:hypothetical protein